MALLPCLQHTLDSLKMLLQLVLTGIEQETWMG